MVTIPGMDNVGCENGHLDLWSVIPPLQSGAAAMVDGCAATLLHAANISAYTMTLVLEMELECQTSALLTR